MYRPAMRLAVVGVLVTGCGRIGIDPIDRFQDAAIDAVVDAVPVCPAGTTELEPGSAVCIELVERGTVTWLSADAKCSMAGRRLCTDAEWLLSCRVTSGLVDMYADEGGNNENWEWTADVSSGRALKRGFTTCDDTAMHAIETGDYDFRCCAAKL